MRRSIGILIANMVCLCTCFASTYFIDPGKGRITNSGSAASPWNTLASVLQSKKGAIKPGDTIFLRRGYHGAINFNGHNSKMVQIFAEPGHTPVVRSVTFSNCSNWHIKGLTISPTLVPSNQGDQSSGQRGVNLLKGATKNIVEDCYLVVEQDTTGWPAHKWSNGLKAGININGGSKNIILGNHMYNAGKIGINFGSPRNYIGYNTVENFPSDGFGIKGNGTFAEYNLIMNSHRVSSNHNDLCQAYGSGTVFRFNELRAYSNPKQPYLGKMVQGLGMFDGIMKDWLIEGNLVRIDHPAGIFIVGNVSNFIIKNNIITRIDGNQGGKAKRQPRIAVTKANKKKWPKKSGATPRGITITGNRSWGNYEINVNNNGTKHVIANNKVDRTWSPPADSSAPSVPTNLKSVRINGYGYDLHWNASTDNRKVIGYEIYHNGKRVGRTRTGTNFFAHNPGGGGTYTVKAYDYRNNFSAASRPANSGSSSSGDSSPPSTPTSVRASFVRDQGVDLHWSPSKDNHKVQAYEVYRNGVKIGRSRQGTTYFDPHQVSSAKYTIRAYDYNNNFSGLSSPASFSTNPPPPPPAPAPDSPNPKPDLKPDSPNNDSTAGAHSLVGKRIAATSIELSWKAPEGISNIKEYRIVLGANNSNWKMVKTVNGNTLKAILTASNGIKTTVAKLQVRAILQNGSKLPMSSQISVTTQANSPPSDPTPDPEPEISIQTTNTPGGAHSLTGERISTTSIKLSWKAPSRISNIREYGIVLGDNNKVWKRIKTVQGNILSFLLTQKDGIKTNAAKLQVRAILNDGTKLPMSSQITVAPF